MKRFWGVRCRLCLIIVSGLLGTFLGTPVVFAAAEGAAPAAPAPETLDISSRFPVLNGESGSSFTFQLELDYHGSQTKLFNFTLAAPSGWEAVATDPAAAESSDQSSGGSSQSVLAAMLEPNLTYPEEIDVVLSPSPGTHPQPGDYGVTFEAAAGELKANIELKAVVTDVPLTYDVGVATANGRLDFLAKPGVANPLVLNVVNSGTGALHNIGFTTQKSDDWATTFTPSVLETLGPGESHQVTVAVTPPVKTISGDYHVVITATANSASSPASANADIRVSLETSAKWSGVGIAIVVAVVAGLAVMFMRLGSRSSRSVGSKRDA